MMNESRTENGSNAPLQLTRISDLLGKKSVRATFKLHPNAIKLISILASQLGIKQKSLFDYLMEDEDALHEIARSLPPDTGIKEQRIQKTFVVSQRSLAVLEEATKHATASRDALIEHSIQRLLPVLEKERIRQRRRAEALSRIAGHFKQGNVLVNEVEKIVGKEDTLYQSLVTVIAAYKKVYAEMEKLVDKGRRISEFPIDALKGK
jgi:hypothetical protein